MKIAKRSDLVMEHLANPVMDLETDPSLNFPVAKKSNTMAAHRYYHGRLGLRSSECRGGTYSSPSPIGTEGYGWESGWLRQEQATGLEAVKPKGKIFSLLLNSSIAAR